MPDYKISDDGKWVWNGKEWLPVPDKTSINLFIEKEEVGNKTLELSANIDEIYSQQDYDNELWRGEELQIDEPSYETLSIPSMIELPNLIEGTTNEESDIQEFKKELDNVKQELNNPWEEYIVKSEKLNSIEDDTYLRLHYKVPNDDSKTSPQIVSKKSTKKVNENSNNDKSTNSPSYGRQIFGVLFVIAIVTFTPIISNYENLSDTVSVSNGRYYYHDFECPNGCYIDINLNVLSYGTLELITKTGSGSNSICNGGNYVTQLSQSSVRGDISLGGFLDSGSYSVIVDNTDCGNKRAEPYGGLVEFELKICQPHFEGLNIVSAIQCTIRSF